MKRLIFSTKFKKDYKHLQARQAEKLQGVLLLLQEGRPLPFNARAHGLIGKYLGCMDCHLEPDLVLIYRDTGDAINFYRVGSHSRLKLG